MMSNAYCKKCGEIEPENHDSQKNGLWLCSCDKKRVTSNVKDFLKKYPSIKLKSAVKRK